MPSTSTSGPHHFIRTSWASVEQVVEPLVGEVQHLDQLVVRQPLASVEDLGAGALEDVGHGKQDSPSPCHARRRGRVADVDRSGARPPP